jgi:thiol-disulfide isomerase/thioredoxin
MISFVSHDESDPVVFVMSPWCLHCHKMKPRVAKIAEVVHSKSKIEFFYYEDPVNEHPDGFPDFRAYPTIAIWSAGQKEKHPNEHTGMMTSDEIAEFVHKHVVNKFDLPTVLKEIHL